MVNSRLVDSTFSVNVFQLKTTRNISVIEQVGFFTGCKRDHTHSKYGTFQKKVSEKIIIGLRSGWLLSGIGDNFWIFKKKLCITWKK